MFNVDSSPTVTNCTFTGNSASPTVLVSYGGGGGMYNSNSSAIVTNCTFNGNLSDSYGGGLSNSNSSPTVTNCTFIGNTARDGGGMYNYEDSNPSVTDCTFSGNSADRDGGGMYNLYYSSPMVANCIFGGNFAYHVGGGMFNYESCNPTVTGCIFSGNEADWSGGMFNWKSNPIVTSCTFSGNQAARSGGMFNWESNPTVTNCIFWGNTTSNGNEIDNDSSTTVISYCDIAGSGGSGSWDTNLGIDGGGNIDIDPLFADPNGPDGISGNEDDNLRLLAGSPCIDTGDNSVVDANSTDLDGNPRIVNSTVDMGAYESFYTNTPPVAKAGDDQIVYICADGAAVVQLDGSGSFDVDGDELEYLWTWEIEGTVFDANGVSPVIELPVGEHTIELTVDDGVEVSEPNWCVIEVLEGIEVDLRVMPRVINRKSHMKRILAVVQLPAGVDGDDIDGSFWLYPGEIEPQFSRLMTVNGSQKLFMVFDKSMLMAAVGANGPVVLEPVVLEIEGQLISGQCLYGKDRIRIIRRGQGPKDQTGLRRKGTRSRRKRIQNSR